MLKAKSGPSDDDVDQALSALEVLNQKLVEAKKAQQTTGGTGGGVTSIYILSEMPMEKVVGVYI
jgi:hypothetical protein